MHDAKGRELKVGDIVMVPAKVTECNPSEDYCNVAVQTLLGRRPDDQKERFSGFNTGVLLRHNIGDTNDFNSYQDAPEVQDPKTDAETPVNAGTDPAAV